VARHWLTRSQSPYVDEVRTIADELRFPGVWFLNGSYQWCCTAVAREEDAVPWLARTLDWPFPGLGRHVEVVRMRGPAGEFFNVTWPGYVGALTALAPGRFAAAINQAPMWRRTRVPLLRFYDAAANAICTLSMVRQIPPDQLLRRVLEECETFEQARHRLETTPVARPVIFTLAGCRPGDYCVIERTEERFSTRTENTAAANDWLVSTAKWEARVGGAKVFTSTFADAAANSRERRELVAEWSGRFADGGFGWVQPPVLNRYTRIAVEMCPARGILRVQGYELTGGELPEPATSRWEIGPERAAA